MFLWQLEQELHKNHVSPTGTVHGLRMMESNPVDERLCSTTADEIGTHHRHSISAEEVIAELDGPTSIPGLLEMLREKNERIQVLEDNLSRVIVKVKCYLLCVKLSVIKFVPKKIGDWTFVCFFLAWTNVNAGRYIKELGHKSCLCPKVSLFLRNRFK